MTEKTRGEKLRIQAAILCKNPKFQEFCYQLEKRINVDEYGLSSEDGTKLILCDRLKILSRSEIAHDKNVQEKFKQFYKEYNDWLNPVDEQYADNLSREF